MKASLNRATIVVSIRPETRRSIHGQGEARRKAGGSPHQCMLQDAWMSCG